VVSRRALATTSTYRVFGSLVPFRRVGYPWPMRLLAGTSFLFGLALATSCSNTTRQVGTDSSGGAGESGTGGSASSANSGGSAGEGESTASENTSSAGAGGTSAGGSSSAGGSANGGSAGTGGSSNVGGSSNAGGSSNSGGSSSTGGASTGGTGGTPTCTDAVVEDDMASGQTAPAGDQFSPSCGNGSSSELVFEWVAPYSDYFMFDSVGSDFDTVVTVFSDCDGTELACNNTAPGSIAQGLAVAEVTAGETYWIAVEGNNGETGEVQLAMAPVVCPSADLTGQPLPATFTTVGGTTNHEPRCTGQDVSSQPEKTIRYVPEVTGLYRFSAASSAVRVLLSLYEGSMCGGAYLQCSYGQVGSASYPAEVTRHLEAGQAVTLVIEGEDGAGEFDVDIELLEEEAELCEDLPELGTGQSGSIDPGTDLHALSSSCNWAGNGVGSYAEHLYRFTVDEPAGDASCYITLEDSSVPVEMYVLSGDRCEGPEFACEATGGYHSFSRSDNGVYTLVVENTDPFQGTGTYTISSTCD